MGDTLFLTRSTINGQTQNWLRAILNFALVVLAALLAITLSDWRKARQTSLQSEIATDRLTADLRQEAWIYSYVLAYHEDVLENAAITEKNLSGESTLSDAQFLIAAYRASQYTWWNPRRTTFDELMGTGRLDLITDDTLRRSALAVYASPLLPALAKSGEAAPYRQKFRQIVPTHIQQALSEACGDKAAPMEDYAALSDILTYECSLTLADEDIQTGADLLRNTPGIAGTLRLRISTLETELADLHERNQVTLFFENLKAKNVP